MQKVGQNCGSAARTLVLVHDRGFKPPEHCFKPLCVSAMQTGIERDYPELAEDFGRLEYHMAYYGDITGQYLRKQGLSYDEALDIGDLKNTLADLRRLDKRKKFSLDRYDRLPGKSPIREFLAEVLEPVILHLGLSRKIVSRVGLDLAEYFNAHSDFSLQVRERIRNVITNCFDNDSKILLVTHGTGCIAAYDTLWELSHNPLYAERYQQHKIDLWLTLGAPLGDAMVKKRVFGAQLQGNNRYPANVISWHNLAAEDDYLSHNGRLADSFYPMLTQKQISTIRDYKITNLAVRYGQSNPHHSLGYLIHPRTAKIISGWLVRNPETDKVLRLA